MFIIKSTFLGVYASKPVSRPWERRNKLMTSADDEDGSFHRILSIMQSERHIILVPATFIGNRCKVKQMHLQNVPFNMRLTYHCLSCCISTMLLFRFLKKNINVRIYPPLYALICAPVLYDHAINSFRLQSMTNIAQNVMLNRV